ncbi:MAG: MlaD family protein [Gammaproteobacteria bacterium]
MESKANYTLVGMAVVALLFGLIITALWLSEGFDHKSYNNYLVYMREAVTGLSEGSLVKYNGVKVGTVSSISIDKDPSLVKLVLQIEEGTPITVSTEAFLIPQGITGTTYLGLSSVSSDRTPLKVKPGCLYPVISYRPSLLFQLETTVADFSKSMKSFLSPQNSENFKKILDNFQRVSGILAVNDQALEQTIEKMPKLLDEMRESVDRFSTMSRDMSSAGRQLKATMVTGKDTLDIISQQTMPPTISLVHRLDIIAGNIERLSADLRRNPAMLIRGAAPPRKGPGE